MLSAKQERLIQLPLLQSVQNRDAKHAKAVLNGPKEIDRRCFFEILRRTGDFAKQKIFLKNLRKNLIVEDEILGVIQKRNRLKHLTRVRPVTGVVLGKLGSEQEILDKCEYAITDIFPERHAPAERMPTENARCDDGIVGTVDDHGAHGKNEMRIVLIIGMQHHHNVCMTIESSLVTRLLISAVPSVPVMHDGRDAECRRLRRRVVPAAVVNENDLVNDVFGHILVRVFQCFSGVVRRHDNDDAFSVKHRQRAVYTLSMTERTRTLIHFFIVMMLGLSFSLPHVLFSLRAMEPVLLKITTTDDGHYLARVKAALLGRTNEVRNGVTGGHPPADGSAPALVELIVGTAFSWTKLKAPHVMLLLTVFLTPWVFLLLLNLLRSFVPWSTALIGSVFYVTVFLSALQKPVNMSLSLPISIATIFVLWKNWREPKRWSTLLSGILLGALPSVYFWSWTYIWSLFGWLFILHFCFSETSPLKTKRTKALLASSAIAVIVSLPFLIDLIASFQGGGIFTETAFRSTIIHSRGVESLPRAILISILVLCSIVLARKTRKDIEHWILPLASILGIATAMYQNLIHGIIFSFSSHFYPFLCLSALFVGVWAWSTSLRWARIVAGLASIFLVLGLWDFRSVWSVLAGNYYVRDIAHLRPVTMILDDGNRQTVLSDKVSSHMVTSWTDDDVVFTAYVKHMLVSDQEYVERYCLSEAFSQGGPDLQWLASEVVETKQEDLIAAKKIEFKSFCDPVLTDPQKFLKKYDVHFLLWNERLRPDFGIKIGSFRLQERGSGWSLWRLDSAKKLQ